MNKENNYITCKRVTFYSMLDEDMFFDWIKNIKCIASFENAKDELYLDLIDHPLNYDDAKNLIALLYRYKIDMKQLQQLINDSNKDAFEPWHTEIFGSTEKYDNHEK